MLAPLPWRSGSVDVNGVKIAYDVVGEGAPMLLIMGLSTQSIFWPDELCADLVDAGFRLIRFDNRDIGLSGSVDNGLPVRITADFLRSRINLRVRASYTLFDMVKDAVGLLDHLEVDQAHVFGISMGGIIGQMLAAEHPERVRTLSLFMSHTNHRLFGVPHPRILPSMGPPPAGASRDEIIDRSVVMFQTLASPAYRRSVDQLRFAAAAAYDRDHRPAGMARQTHALFATPCIDDMLPRIQAPTLVAHGLSDLLVLPINSRRIAARIPKARLQMFPGMGHDFPPALLATWARLITDNARRREP